MIRGSVMEPALSWPQALWGTQVFVYDVRVASDRNVQPVWFGLLGS